MPAEIKIFPDPSGVTQEAARRIVAVAGGTEGIFSLVLCGGNTPKTLYEILASPAYRSQIDWSKIEIYFGDERCVGPTHPESNYLMAQTALLGKVPIDESRVHRIRGEIDPQAAAIEYGRLLKSKFADGGADMLLLGMGDDGHTASLFPGTAALSETHHRCVANFVPKLNAWRVTLTYPFLNKSAAVMILAVGAAKAQRLAEVLHGPRDPARLPIQGIEPASGKLAWVVDAAAASRLGA
jgi:6-phosphogluconolactonase